MRRSQWLVGIWLLLPAGVLLAGESSKATVKGTTIPADTVPLKPGGGLSYRTPVARPGALKGARSWTIETRRHRWAPIDLAVSPDGTIVATSGYDGMVRLWDAESGRLLRVLVGHDSYVYGMAWSADGRYLASAGTFDATVRVWEARTGLPLRVLKGLDDAPGVVAWSPDGSLLATGTHGSGYVIIHKPANGTLVKKIATGKPILSLRFSPDGGTLACAISQVGVSLVTVPGWVAADKVEMAGQDPMGVAFTADGKQLIVGGTRDSLVWDLAGKKVARKFGAAFHALARHGTRLAVASPAGKVWDLSTGQSEPATLPAGRAVGWSADGNTLCVLTGDDVVRADPIKGTELKRWSVAESGSVGWSPGRPMLTGIGTNKPRLWDPATGKPQGALLDRQREGPRGKPGASTTEIPRARPGDLWAGGLQVAAWSPGGKVLVTGSSDRSVRVWNPATGKLLRTGSGLDGPVTALAVASDGKIAAGVGSKVVVFPPEATRPLRVFTGHTEAVRCLAWGRDGSLASGGADTRIHVWGLKSARPLRTLENGGSVECLAFAPGGKLLAAGSPENKVRVWTYPGRKLLHEFTSLGSPPAVTSVAWSPDSALLLAGRANHTIQLWDLKLGKERHSFVVMAPVHAVAWGAGGKTMVSCTIDRSVRFWNTATGRIHATVVAEKDQLACVSAEGHYRVPNEAQTELVHVVLTAAGMDTLSLKEFRAKFGWKNNPTRARMTGN
jgi:WD40 repeat protein